MTQRGTTRGTKGFDVLRGNDQISDRIPLSEQGRTQLNFFKQHDEFIGSHPSNISTVQVTAK
jgi:hypothetical protein